MATLKDGRFIFIHADRQHLLIEQSSTAAAAAAGAPTAAGVPVTPVSTHLLYGGVVHAFALNAAQTRIAMICPAYSAAAATAVVAHNGHPDDAADAQAVLRLFSFAGGEVGELIDELVTVAAQSVVWVADRYLALSRHANAAAAPSHSDSNTTTSSSASPAAATVLVEVIKSSQRLRLLREDKTSIAPTAGPGSLLCDVAAARQSVRLSDLQRSKTMTEAVLPNRKCRHGKARVAASSCSDGPFLFVANDDWTVHGFYVGRGGSLHAPRPMLTQFESQSASQSAAKTGEEEKEEESQAVPRPAAVPFPRLHVRMLSDTQVLLGLTGSPTILQCAYDPTSKEEGWVLAAKMRLPRRLHATAQLVGLSKNRCLVCQRAPLEAEDGEEGQEQRRSCTYLSLPLEMRSTGKNTVQADTQAPEATALTAAAAEAEGEKGENAAAAAAAASNGTTAEGKKKRKKKAKAAASSDGEGGTANPPSAAASEAGGGNGGGGGNATAGGSGPTQRAVQRLLVHAGISGKDQVPNAFVREERAETSAAPSGEGTAAAAGAAAAARVPAGGKSRVSMETMVNVGCAVLGVAIGVTIMRKLSFV